MLSKSINANNSTPNIICSNNNKSNLLEFAFKNKNDFFYDDVFKKIKNKFIKLRLEKDGRNFKDFNDNRNDRTDQMKKRNIILKKAKHVAESPYNLNVNINN